MASRGSILPNNSRRTWKNKYGKSRKKKGSDKKDNRNSDSLHSKHHSFSRLNLLCLIRMFSVNKNCFQIVIFHNFEKFLLMSFELYMVNGWII